MKMRFSELVQKLGDAVTFSSLTSKQINDADGDLKITGVAAVDEASSGTISFVDGEQFVTEIEKTAASALILPMNEALHAQATARGIAWIATSQPRLMFARAIALFYQPFRPTPEIHATAVIHPSAHIGTDVYIGSHVAIQAGVKIGDGVCIYPNVVIYPEVQIGDRTILHANCTIHERTLIGADCVIHSSAVIGAEGFGFVPTSVGLFKMEQSGRTVLEDEVEVGCSSAIDRPSVGETRISRNTKIDNLVHIAHGCQVGQSCAIAGQAGLSGSVTLGNRVMLAGQAGISNNVKMGDGAIATAKAGLHHNVEPGAIVTGIPAIPHKLFVKTAAIYRRLPEMYQAMRQLQRQFDEQKVNK